MKRIALVFFIVSLLLFADGIYLQAANDQVGGDTGVLFGNPNLVLSAGTVVLISAGLLILGAAIMWMMAARREATTRARRPGRAQAAAAQPEQPEQPGGRTASRA